MTTLPQTTTVRLPRPAAPAPMYLPAAQPAGAGAAPISAGQLSGADVWRVIRSNLWLILIMVAIAGVGGFVLNMFLARNYPRYTAMGLLEVRPTAIATDILRETQTQAIMDRNATEIEQRTQAQLLKHEALIGYTLQRSEKIRATSWFGEFSAADKAKEDLMDKLSVSPIPDTKLISVAMSYRVPKDCMVIVEELVNEHLKQQRDLSQNKQQERSMMLNDLKIRYEIRQKDLAQQLREKAVKLQMDGMGVPGHVSSKELELSDLVRKQLDLQAIFTSAKTAQESVAQQMQVGQDPPEVEEALSRDPLIMQYRQQMDQADVQLATTAIKLGTEHPQTLMLQKQRESLQKKLDEVKSEQAAKARVAVVEKLRQQAMQSQHALEQVVGQMNKVHNELAELSSTLATYLTLKDEETAVRELLKQVNEQRDAMEQVLTRSDLSGVAWRQRPALPDRMSFPKLPVTMALAIALGLAASLGIAFLREMMDTSVRSPRDIARVGQMNLLGMVPDEADDPQSAGARLPLVIFEAPHSILAEQFRQVRTRLQHAASLDTTRSLLITSPSPGDGKSTVACNLAAGLALNGRRILLVDANFRKPELHRTFALSNERGFSDVLNAIDQFEQSVQETAVPNLAVLPSGPRPTNPTELLESQLLIDFIERGLEEYDHVIFDSGPMLFVSETVALAPRVDGVVTVVRARANSRGLLQRMRDGLRQIKAEHLGVVLNAVRAQAGGYYNRNIKTYYAYSSQEA